MERLLLLINSLPHVLQNLIGEYNVEHRLKMKFVLSELKHKLKMKTVFNELTKYERSRLICEGCYIRKLSIYSISPFNFICSKKCLKNFVSLIPDGCSDKNYYEQMFNF